MNPQQRREGLALPCRKRDESPQGELARGSSRHFSTHALPFVELPTHDYLVHCGRCFRLGTVCSRATAIVCVTYGPTHAPQLFNNFMNLTNANDVKMFQLNLEKLDVGGATDEMSITCRMVGRLQHTTS